MGLTRSLWCLLIAFWLAPPALAEVIVRVEIAQTGSPLVIGTSTPAQILDSEDNPLGQLPAMQPIQADPTAQGIALSHDNLTAPVIRIRPEGDGLVAVEGRWYPGEIILAGYGTVLAVNYVDLENYVAGVVEFEMGSSFHGEALKAQAVAARSYVLYHRNSRPWFDVHSDTRSQVYRGYERLSPAVWEATQATRGMVMVYDNQFINAMYSSSSGGHTVGVEGVPYLQGFPDVTQRPRFGHGIGMSQWGAQDLAAQGWSFNHILGYYYRGVGLARLPQ
jgi:stage II sporulation protein D